MNTQKYKEELLKQKEKLVGLISEMQDMHLENYLCMITIQQM